MTISVLSFCFCFSFSRANQRWGILFCFFFLVACFCSLGILGFFGSVAGPQDRKPFSFLSEPSTFAESILCSEAPAHRFEFKLSWLSSAPNIGNEPANRFSINEIYRNCKSLSDITTRRGASFKVEKAHFRVAKTILVVFWGLKSKTPCFCG